jgi:hypothetical protein
VPRRRAITGTFKIRIVQPDQPARETDMKRTAGADVNRTLRIAALDVAVGRIGFERVVAETTGRPALAT